MNAPIKEAMVMAIMIIVGKSSLEAVHASCRAPDNLIDAALLANTNREKRSLPSLLQQPPNSAGGPSVERR